MIAQIFFCAVEPSSGPEDSLKLIFRGHPPFTLLKKLVAVVSRDTPKHHQVR